MSDAVLNLQSLQSFKANIYSTVFDNKLGETMSPKISAANNVKRIQAQRESLRFVGDMLQITPDLPTFPLFREFYKEHNT